MDAKVVHGIAIADFQLARDVLEQRYHCHADEHLLIAEVLQPEEQRAALTLHRLWEVETAEFVELMEVSENPR